MIIRYPIRFKINLPEIHTAPGPEPRYGVIKGSCDHRLSWIPDHLIPIFARLAIEVNLIIDILTFDFERVAIFQPIIWDLHLASIDNFLLKNAIIVPDSIAPGRNL